VTRLYPHVVLLGRPLLLAGLLLVGLLSTSACRTDHATGGSVDEGAAAQQVAAFELRPDTQNLLLTCVAEDGDFHVVERIQDVPEGNREHVRVVKTDPMQGTGKTVFVANLTQPSADGQYPIHSMTRAEWDAIGAQRRGARLEALAPTRDATLPQSKDAAHGELRAVVYGADWCKPCHDAEAYLKSLGVQVTKKNIETSRAAQAEMQAKLQKIQRTGAGIPVIDLMGQLFVGFSKPALKRAVAQAREQLDRRG